MLTLTFFIISLIFFTEDDFRLHGVLLSSSSLFALNFKPLFKCCLETEKTALSRDVRLNGVN